MPKATPLGRVDQPFDVARIVAFLASAAADFVTGQTISVDGGLFAKPYWPYEQISGRMTPQGFRGGLEDRLN